MKKLILILAMGVGACQQSAPPVSKPSSPVTIIRKDTSSAIAKSTVPVDTLTSEMLTLLKQFNLAPLWADTSRQDGYPTLVGFFGPDNYGISMVFDNVQRDSIQPQLFYVHGRSRYRKNIIPFEGTLRVRRIMDFDSCDYLQYSPEDSARAYTAAANFSLKQDNQRKDTGVFSGEALLDFSIDRAGYYSTVATILGGHPEKHSPTKGCGRLVRGVWTNYLTKQSKKFVLAKDVFVISSEIYSDFGVGDRGTQVNPKYAKLGWVEMWENEEWWAEPGKPSLNL